MANQVAYGFLDLQRLFDQRATVVGEQVIFDAIDATIAEHNRQITALLGIFATRTTQFQINYQQAGVARLQPGDEKSRARPLEGGGEYTVAFPLQKGDAALGLTYMARQKITVAEVNRRTNLLTMADARWVRDHVLAALVTNVSWSFTDKQHGALTIQPLANGDTVQYLIQAGADQGATDTHFGAQAAAISDGANPFATIHDELLEHPENSGEVVVFVPTNLKASILGLANFVPVPDKNVSQPSTALAIEGTLGIATPGELIGYVDGCWIVWWRSMPSSYMVAMTTGGERALAMREDDTPSLQGFVRSDDRNVYPYYESQWFRQCGFGAWNRVNAYVYYVGGGAYAIPTNYDSPMP